MGPATAIFCAADRLLFRALPYSDPDRLVSLHETQTGKGFRNISLPNLIDWRNQATVFDGIAGFMTRTFGMRVGQVVGGSPPVVIRAGLVTSDLFHALGVTPEAGRTFSEREEQEGRRLVVITDALWAREFGRAGNIPGRTLQLNEEPYEIIGILPAGFVFPDPTVEVDAYVPISHIDYSGRGARPLQGVARIKPGIDFGRAQAALRVIGARLARSYPEENVDGGADMESLDEFWKGGRRRPLALLTVAGFLLLGIVCTNVIHLMLSRTVARRREIAIRTALGAGSAAIVRQMLAEAALLSAGATVPGLLLARWTLQALPAMLRFAGASLPLASVVLDASALEFAGALCLFITLLCGLAPALLTRSLRTGAAIKQAGSPFARNGGGFRMRRWLLVGQVALSLVLLLCAGAFLRVFLKLWNRDPGFRSSRVYHFGFGLPDARYTDRQAADFHFKLQEALRRIPGVEAAGAAYVLPLNGRTNTTSFEFEGAGLPSSLWTWVAYNLVDPGYFTALRIPLLTGRIFSWERDRPGRPFVVVVNRTFQRLYQREGGVLGRRLQLRFATDLAPKNSLWQIIGVVADTYQTGLDKSIRPQVYLPVGQTGLDGGSYLVRTARADPGLPAAVAAAVRAVDPNLERIRLRPLDDWVSASLGDRRMPALLTSVFAGLGLLLTAIGIYGAVALEIAERRREIAIRIALGARQTRIAALVLARGLLAAAAGTAVGILIFLPIARVLETQLYETSAFDPATALAVMAILFAAAMLACLRPLLVAWRLDPLTILRDA